MDKQAFIPKEGGTETSRGINDGTPGNNARRVSQPSGYGESFIQPARINNLHGPGMMLPDNGSSASNGSHVYQDPRRIISEYVPRPQPTWLREPATRNPSWAPPAQRMGMRYMEVMEDEEKDLALCLAPPNALQEPSLTLKVGRDNSRKGKQPVEIDLSVNGPTSSMMNSRMKLREYGKCLSLRPPGTKERSRRQAYRHPGHKASFPKVGWTGHIYHNGGTEILTDFAAVNPNDAFKCMPFWFNYNEHGHLVPAAPSNQSFNQIYWKGADNVVHVGYPFPNQGQALKSLGASTNHELGTQVPRGFTNQPIGQAYGRGINGIFLTTYPTTIQGHGLRSMPAPVGTGQYILPLPAPVYDKGKVVTASAKAHITYKIVEDNAAASSSTGKKDHISENKVVMIPDDPTEFCDETDVVPVTGTGNQEQVNPASMKPINKGKGLLIRRNALQTSQTEAIPKGGIEERQLSESTDSEIPEEDLDTAGTLRKRKHEGAGARRSNGRAQATAFPKDVRSLLSTGVLDGIPVKYATWTRDKVLRGIIALNKILCGCQDCNYTTPINPLDFERHAGGNTKHPNNHIHFPNGKTIYEIVQGLQKVQTENLFQAMETMAGHPLNQEKFKEWKALYQASGIEARVVIGAGPSDAQVSHPCRLQTEH
ncbi:hypothetical protein MLD38_003689 [Melastoma candidum]|uniref:Uncharacterized protein n=1 Tax=Melastoma candidum TaxID=119954 RepID=A0ACB9S3H8_9MYRT|nr:hypothetical protein MLD38_003689 [Melastoma candidum]